MTEQIAQLRERFITQAQQKQLRQPPCDPYAWAERWRAQGLTDTQRAVERLRVVLRAEQPKVWQDETIALVRTVTTLPELYSREEWGALRARYTIHEQGKVCNISPDYAMLLATGFDGQRSSIHARLTELSPKDASQNVFLHSLLDTMDEIEAFAERYRKAALTAGNKIVAESFSVVPCKKPQSFLQALQGLRLLHYCLWASFQYHNTLGRFDQYLYPYYKADLEAGRITQEQALALVEEFFLSCNKDSDLYPGMQQGDNGQSIVLGGYDENGNDCYNDLSELCLCACVELRLIDPKINLRVSSKTPLARYVRGSKLTKLGLGFPQYANDDIVVPCLLHWGYRPEDAYNYAVAACWEFIVPGCGMDIPNLGGLSFVSAVQEAMAQMPQMPSFAAFLQQVQRAVAQQADTLISAVGEIYMEPAPLMSLLMHGCVDTGRDISQGNRYNNYGFHGTGLSTAVDSLAAIRQFVFEEKRFTPQQMLVMTQANFEGYETENNMLRYEAPKMGNDDDSVDALATLLLDWFADALEGKTNSRGGIYRAGTGSAMYYIWHAREQAATPDGRRREEALACNYSPSLFSRCKGPVSILKSFAKPHLQRVANGGPLTLELHDTVFRNEESVEKVGMLVKSFMDMGGHQLQINAVNCDTLKDAKKHPENHRNLIVRVWGWSGYFVELDEVYQNHILERMELTL